MKNKIATIISALALSITLTVPMSVNAQVSTTHSKLQDLRVPRYTTEVAVVGYDRGEKNLVVFYKNGQIHEFKSDFENKFAVGQVVKVHFKTHRTKSVKDDEVLDVYKTHLRNQKNKKVLRAYSQEYKHFMKIEEQRRGE